MKYLSWNTFIKAAAAQHCNVLCKSGHILQCSFEDNFNVILCKRYTCMRTQQLIIHRMKASTTQPPFYIVLNMMRQTPMRDDARLNVCKYIHSLLYLLQKCYATTPAVSDLFMTNVVCECISSYVSWYNFLLLYSKIWCRYVHFWTWMEGYKSGVVILKVECFR